MPINLYAVERPRDANLLTNLITPQSAHLVISFRLKKTHYFVLKKASGSIRFMATIGKLFDIIIHKLRLNQQQNLYMGFQQA